MVNLKILRFRTLTSRASASILHGCTCQLEVFDWDICDDVEQISEFLQTQPHLRIFSGSFGNVQT